MDGGVFCHQPQYFIALHQSELCSQLWEDGGRIGLCVLSAGRKLEEDLGVLLLTGLPQKKQISQEVSFLLAMDTS